MCRAWCRSLALFKIYALSVLAFVGSVSEPDKETVTAENLALQGLSAGPFSHIFPSFLLRRGSGCGLKIDVDDSQLTSKAARFRVAFRSAQLSSGMERIRAAKDHCDRTLDSFAASWDEKYFRPSTAYFTTSAFQLLNGTDSLRCRRNLLVHEMQSFAATLKRQSDNVLDIAQAICIACTCLWRSSVVRSIRANLVLSLVPHVSHVMVCARLPDSILSKKILAASWCALKDLIARGIIIAPQPCPTTFVLSGLALANAFLPRQLSMTYFSKLLFAVTDFASLCPDC